MARRLLIAPIALCLVGAAPPQGPLAGAAAGRQLVFDRVPLSIVADAIMRRVSDKPFLLCDPVLQDKRLVSLRLEPFQLRPSTVANTFAAYGYSLRQVGGVYQLCPTAAASAPAATGPAPVNAPAPGPRDAPADYAGRGGNLPLGSPLDPTLTPAPTTPARAPVSAIQAVQAYRPDFVAPAALREALAAVLPELTLSVVEAGGQRPALFARGEPEAVEQFYKLVTYLDSPPDAVEVQAIVAEVSDTVRSGFSVSVILDALRSNVGLNLGSQPLEQSLSFSGGSFDAVLSAVAGTSNVRVVSSPRLRGRSGETLRLQVGSDVPTLGAVLENPIGSTQQSVQYRSSGVIFEVSPRVYGKRIALDLHQEVSAFAATETGVRGSPTLTKRSIDTKADLESGDWVILGGLRSTETSRSRSNLLGVPLGKVRAARETELVILLNVRRVQQLADRPDRLGRMSELPKR